MIEPIPHDDEADIAEQARPVDDGIDEPDALPDALGQTWETDAGRVLDQQLVVRTHDDDHPPVGGHAAAASVTRDGFWPAWEFNSFGTPRSFIDDMASRYEPYRPAW